MDSRKEIAKEYIKKNILNEDLVKIQESLHELKNTVTFDDNSDGEQNTGDFFGLDKIMEIIFNEKGEQRSKLGFEANKLKSLYYYLISEKGKENLDLLYNELGKNNSIDELKKSLGLELSQLTDEISSNNGGGNSIESGNDNGGGGSIGGGSNVESGNGNVDSKIENLQATEKYIYRQCKLYGVTDDRQIAYVLSTVKGECNFKNIREVGGESRMYGKMDSVTKQSYYGRGFVQLTHKKNYEKFTNIIRESGLNFRDNKGNIIKGSDVDLVYNPDLILESNDLASFILVYGMKNGTFTGKKLNDFINNEKIDYYNARKIVNGLDKAKKFENDANNYFNSIKNGGIDGNNEIIHGTEILAENRDQLGGIGNSIMYGIQGLNGKSEFTNMDGVESKNTTNHPDRFKSQKDVEDYAKNHPGVKSFMFYFGGNTPNNSQTLGDIEKWSKRLQQKGIQPVLATCIGEQTHISKTGEKWLIPLNESIRSLGNKLNCPVIDFAKVDDKISKSSDGVHPNGAGYQKMREIIDEKIS